MKKILGILILLAAGIQAPAQLQIEWERVYGSPAIEYGYGVRSCPDSGYIVAGTTSMNGVTDGYLLRMDTLGMLLWSKTFGGNNVDVFRSIRILPDSGFIIAGYSNSAGHGGYDGWLLRTDKDGDTLWTKYIGTPDWDFFYDVYPTWDGGFILAGGTYGAGAGDEDMYFVRTDMNGDTLWTRTYGGIYEDEARSICETGDSLLVTCGFSMSLGDTLGDAWILRMEENGDTIWTRTLGEPTTKDKAYGIANCSRYSRIFVTGETNAAGNADGFVRALGYAGNTIYTDLAGGNLEDYFTSIVTRAEGTSTVYGVTYSYGGGNGDCYFFGNRYTTITTTHGTLQEDKGFALDTTLDNGYILCGYTTGFSSNLPNIYLVKTDSIGNSTNVLSIHEQGVYQHLASSSVFPNPASEQVTINIDSKQNLPVEMQLVFYDLSGRALLKFDSQNWTWISNQTANIQIDISSLPVGIYYYTISGNQTRMVSGKIIKINP